MSLTQFAEVTATTPARLYGLFPKKGVIAVGSDADFAVWDAEREVTIRNSMLHHATDHTPYEDMVVHGWPVTTISRGEVIWHDGKVTSKPGRGRFSCCRTTLPTTIHLTFGARIMTAPGNRLAGKVVLISGAASDIGVAIAARCVAEGASVVCADLEPEAAARTARQHGSAALDAQCDVTDIESARAVVELTRSKFGRLDGYVHNAAAPWHDGSVEDLDPAHWHQEIDVSLTGAFLMSRFVVPAMRESGGGSVVLVASQLGHVATARSIAYCAAKAGLIHLARLMAVDHAADGIRVNSLSPGAVRTGRLLRSWPSLDEADADLGPAHLLGRIGRPEEIGASTAFLLSEDASFVTATDLLVDGGYTAR